MLQIVTKILLGSREEEGKFDVEVTDKSPEFSQIAVQGPQSITTLSNAISADLDDIKKFRFKIINWNGYEMIVAKDRIYWGGRI